jgi:signal transduction histidine kinase
MKEFDLGELIARTLQVIQPQAQHAQVNIVNQSTDALLVGDSERIGQVLHNLFINAIQAMPRGGELLIRSEQVKRRISRLIIEDQGTGFSAEALARATEPFFSEKEGGMGIGLAVASEICVAHGAALGICNRDEGGGRVTIRFNEDSAS